MLPLFWMVGKREAHKIVLSSRSTLFRISGSHNFDQTLKLGSWKHLEKISKFVHVTFVLVTFVQITNISAVTDLLLANFKSRFLGKPRADSNSCGDICPSNICFGDICPYQKLSQLLLTWFWPKIKDRILGPSLTDVYSFVEATNDLTRLVHISNISSVSDPILTHIFFRAKFYSRNLPFKVLSKSGQ